MALQAVDAVQRAIVWLADSTPSPSKVDDNLVTPGVIGFLVTFVIAIATVLLILDMNRRVRRVRYREEIREMLAAEQGAVPEHGADEPPRPDSATGRADP